MSNINDLLDQTLDDIEDLPEFKAFPPGLHRVLFSFNVKEIAGKQKVEGFCKLIETAELSEPTRDTAPEPGSTASTLYDLSNKYGADAYKKAAEPIGALLGTRSNREIVDQTKDLECMVLTVYGNNDKDPTKPYMNIKELYIV